MRKKRTSNSKLFNRADLFGPPPLLEGEDPAAYDQMVAGILDAVKPTDFIEEMWARDLTDAAWTIIRFRRTLAAHLSAKVWEIANDKASSLAEANPKLMEGPEKEEMTRLLSSDSELSWEELVAQNPRANKKFQRFWKSAKATLDMIEIQGKVINNNIDAIERIEHLIAVAEHRYDAIIRELDRHRVMQKHIANTAQRVEESELKTIDAKPILRKITSRNAA